MNTKTLDEKTDIITPFPLFAYIQLLKPRILTMVLITTSMGYFLGNFHHNSPWIIVFTLLGVGLGCGASGVFNHYLERELDKSMHRTQNRALPQGTVTPLEAFVFGIVLLATGIGILLWQVNLLTAMLVLSAFLLYVLIYTPLKRITWLNTPVGAIPGAIPPLAGWAAATGQLEMGAWILFFILFAWQHPHFYAIAWMYREDYSRAGLKMLPVVNPDGKSTFYQIIFFSFMLLFVSLLPFAVGMTGIIYLCGAIILGIAVIVVGFSLASSKSHADARKLLRASILYLPLLLLLIIIDIATI